MGKGLPVQEEPSHATAPLRFQFELGSALSL
jgi:hypothetical protein